MLRKPIQTDQAPGAIGTYSQAIRTGDLLFISGQIPLEPVSMTVVDGDFKTRVRQVFQNLQHVTEAAGGNLSNAVKVTIFLTDMNDFAAVNEVMSEFFTTPYPARAAVGVAALPKGVDVEADAVVAL
ncbi:MAG: RidA family protein [Pseudomonadota bacterium]